MSYQCQYLDVIVDSAALVDTTPSVVSSTRRGILSPSTRVSSYWIATASPVFAHYVVPPETTSSGLSFSTGKLSEELVTFE